MVVKDLYFICIIIRLDIPLFGDNSDKNLFGY